jgi:hypothetical protein
MAAWRAHACCILQWYATASALDDGGACGL